MCPEKNKKKRMKHFNILFLALIFTVSGFAQPSGQTQNTEPPREKGQKSVLQLAVDPIPTVRVGFIGLGNRGTGAVGRYTFIEGVEIKALCDLDADKVKRSQNTLAKRGLKPADE
ncbi:MAG TPA: glycosyl hydrolase, partial [Porphyromonadaceae bacterium]|nr:glycosyl hydrolase [Porphyromonadaceae bacterium]